MDVANVTAAANAKPVKLLAIAIVAAAVAGRRRVSNKDPTTLVLRYPYYQHFFLCCFERHTPESDVKPLLC